jgi:hypothetical protein
MVCPAPSFTFVPLVLFHIGNPLRVDVTGPVTPVAPEQVTPESFTIVIELKTTQLPGVIGPMAVIPCALADAIRHRRHRRHRRDRARRFIGTLSELPFHAANRTELVEQECNT